MGSQPPEGGDKHQGENNNNTNIPNNTNAGSNSNYKDIAAGLNNSNDTSTPGKKKSSFDGDFIIISEFSEQVGPVPIDIIPDWNSAGTFDLNTFVLKIMAVDFQNKSNDPQSYLKDSQVAMPEPNEDAYTYLHHFNLLDVYARGYVRPMCISYITHDRNKIMDYFHEIMAKVTKITKVMKRSNHRLFLRDLEERMADVRHTQAVMNSGQEMDTISPTPVTVNEYLADLEVMHQKFHRAVALKQQRRAARDAGSGSGGSKGSPYSHRSTPQPDDDEDDFEDDEEWEKKHEGEGRKRQGSHGEKSLNKAVAELSKEYQPQVIQSLHPRTLHGKSLRDLRGLCEGNLGRAMALLQCLHRHYSRPCTVLALDAFDTPSLAPASSLLTIGQSVMLNFNLEMDKYMNIFINLEAERALTTGNVAALAHNTNATQTVTSNSSSVDDDSSSYGSARSMGSAASSPGQHDDLYLDEAMLVNGISAAHAELVSHGMRVPPNPGTEHEDNSATPDASPGEEKSALKPKLMPNINFFSANLWPPLGQTEFPGKGLLDLRGKFVWLRHVIYSILRGRPVVIWGSAQNESVVRGMVQALSILVAGNNAGISPWRTKSLKMSDLATFKLAGLLRTCQIPKAVEKYVTTFDLENESLKSPPYPSQGKFIDEILSLKKQWPDELSYLAHVHYVLFDIGVKACLYYHLCCVTVHQLTPQQASQAQAYANHSSTHYPPAHGSVGHIHPHSHHSQHHYHTYHPSTHGYYQPAQPPLPRSHSPHMQAHLRQTHPYTPPSPRAPPAAAQTPSPHKPPSQPPSPHPSQPPSPRHAQPPSPHPPHHGPQPPSPRQPQTPTTHPLPPLSPTSPHQPAQPPSPRHAQPPPHSFAPLHPTNTTAEPGMEIRPEAVRLDSSLEIPMPMDTKPDLPAEPKTEAPAEPKPESPTEPKTDAQPEVKTDPTRTEDLSRTRSDSKTDSAKRRKGTIGALTAPMRSHSMSSIGEKYRPVMNNINAHNGNVSTSNTSPPTTVTNTNPNLPTSANAGNMNMNINSSGGFPYSTGYANMKPGEEWRNSSSPSPSSSRHASWQYGKSYGNQGYRSLSDSQISPIFLPTSPATREKTRTQFLHQFEIPQGDSDIVMYLAEVVKEQQACEVQGTETPVIRLDYSSCQVFHSKVTKEGSHTRR